METNERAADGIIVIHVSDTAFDREVSSSNRSDCMASSDKSIIDTMLRDILFYYYFPFNRPKVSNTALRRQGFSFFNYCFDCIHRY